MFVAGSWNTITSYHQYTPCFPIEVEVVVVVVVVVVVEVVEMVEVVEEDVFNCHNVTFVILSSAVSFIKREKDSY